jgi:hypothetical protein
VWKSEPFILYAEVDVRNIKPLITPAPRSAITSEQHHQVQNDLNSVLSTLAHHNSEIELGTTDEVRCSEAPSVFHKVASRFFAEAAAEQCIIDIGLLDEIAAKDVAPNGEAGVFTSTNDGGFSAVCFFCARIYYELRRFEYAYSVRSNICRW